MVNEKLGFPVSREINFWTNGKKLDDGQTILACEVKMNARFHFHYCDGEASTSNPRGDGIKEYVDEDLSDKDELSLGSSDDDDGHGK